MRKVRIYQVDAFTDRPFGGNPAGVVPEAEGLTDEEMQKIAREMNLSETAFVFDLRPYGRNDPGEDGTGKPTTVAELGETESVAGKLAKGETVEGEPVDGEPRGIEPGAGVPARKGSGGEQHLPTERSLPEWRSAADEEDGPARPPATDRLGNKPLKQPPPDFRVRFFTPQTEVDLCGHATIGTFFLLAEEGWIRPPGPVEGADVKPAERGKGLDLGSSGVAEAWSTDGPGDNKEAGDDIFRQPPLEKRHARPELRADFPPPFTAGRPTWRAPTVIYQETKAGLLPVEIHWRPAQNAFPREEAAKDGLWGKRADDKGLGKKGPRDYVVDRVMMHQRPPEFLGRVEDVAELAEILGLAVEEIGAVKAIDSERGTPMGTSAGLANPRATKGEADSGEIMPIEMPVEIVSTGLPDLIVPVVSQEALNRMKPDLNRLKAYCERLGVISVHAFWLPGTGEAYAVNPAGEASRSSDGQSPPGNSRGSFSSNKAGSSAKSVGPSKGDQSEGKTSSGGGGVRGSLDVAPLKASGNAFSSPEIAFGWSLPDAVCRDFAPAVGIPEEAATGTASGALGAYLAAHGVVPRGSSAGYRRDDYGGERKGPGPGGSRGPGGDSRRGSGPGSRPAYGMGFEPAFGLVPGVGSGLGKLEPQRIAGLSAPGGVGQNPLLREGLPKEGATKPGERAGESVPGAVEAAGTVIEGGAGPNSYRFLFLQGTVMGRPSLIEVEVEVAAPEKAGDAPKGFPTGSVPETGAYENIVGVKVGGRAVKVIEGWVWIFDSGKEFPLSWQDFS